MEPRDDTVESGVLPFNGQLWQLVIEGEAEVIPGPARTEED